MKLTTFQTEITPPIGHPLCAGWAGPAVGIDDPLFASGVVIVPEDQEPIVLLNIEWCELSNRSHLRWKHALAEAAYTSPSRCAVHCMHPHMTPWPDKVAQELVETQEGLSKVMDTAWCEDAMTQVAAAIRAAMAHAAPLTHFQTGRALVNGIASNRRILGRDQKIKAVRWTKTADPDVRAEPEGVIDPWLKTISFWNQERKLAALHFYAVHPTSYEDGRVTPDFAGIARARRQQEDGGIVHVYFTECAGDLTAGKYNDGAKENRALFTNQLLVAMRESESHMQRVAIASIEWRIAEVRLPPREDAKQNELRAVLADTAQDDRGRQRAALILAYLERVDTPIEIAALHVNDSASALFLPGEAFIEYQLFAQRLCPERFVAVPAYGDCGPGYICLEKSFDEGGYEPIDSFVAPRSEHLMRAAIEQVMQSNGSESKNLSAGACPHCE